MRKLAATFFAGLVLGGGSVAMGNIAATFTPKGVKATDVCIHRKADGALWFEAWGYADAGTMQQKASGTLDPYTGPSAATLTGALDGPAYRLLVRTSGVGDAGTP